jgi:hypothetical protein
VFEGFDAIGRYRATENGLPVDTSGALVATRDADGPVSGPPELAESLSTSEEVADCFTALWFRYALKRSETDHDDTSIAAMREAFARDRSVVELIVNATSTDAFRYRRLDAIEEVSP